jgi:acetyl esterase/lipase
LPTLISNRIFIETGSMRWLMVILFSMIISGEGFGQSVIALYPDAVPNAKPAIDEEKLVPDHNGTPISVAVQKPTLSIFLPKKPDERALLICPGGGYSIVAIKHEGEYVAKKLSESGITVFVLKYRIPNVKWMVDPEIGPLQDAQQALITIRKNAGKWKIDPGKVGIIGFSAGGHLASTAATHFNKCLVANPDNISVRPDFQILIYPVISFSDSIGHIGSRDNLIGKNASEEKINEYSADKNVKENTPPALFIHSAADESVSYKNSLVYYEALIKKNVPADIHIFSKGGHGFGTIKTNYPIDAWMDIVRDWIKSF